MGQLLKERKLLRLAGVVLLAMTASCGPSRPAMAPVTGTVLYQGEPVEKASVTFLARSGRPGYGETDRKGRFSMLTFEPNDGAVLGEHVVTIAKWIRVDDGDFHGAQAIRRLPSTIHPGEVVTLANFLPERYADARRSALKVTVAADNENDFTFELKRIDDKD